MIGRTLAALAIGVGLALSVAQPAAAVDKIWSGYVVHVSSDNIKVINVAGTQTLSFLVVPHFKQIFSADGKTTYQMASVKHNALVKVYYDQNLLGQRHADKIIVLDNSGNVLHKTGS
jgi:hypothetical protein